MPAPRMSHKDYISYLARRYGKQAKRVRLQGVKSAGAWSEPEKRYYSCVLHGKGDYEAESIRFTPTDAEKHSYTPDFRTITDDGLVVYHEVKGRYRLKSQDAARLRFVMSSVARPEAMFVWAKERKDGKWDMEILRGGISVAKQTKATGLVINMGEVKCLKS